VYIAGNFLCWFNILIWEIYFDKFPTFGGNPNTIVDPSERTWKGSIRQRLLRPRQLLLIPVAVWMSVVPLYSPFIALSMAQKVYEMIGIMHRS